MISTPKTLKPAFPHILVLVGASRTAATYLLSAMLLAGSSPDQDVLASALRTFTAVAPREFLMKLERQRPTAVSAAVRAQIVASLPKEGEVRKLSASQQAKLQSLTAVLQVHDRQSVYVLKVIAAPQAFVGLHARAVVLISQSTIDLLTGSELQALVAHETGHEFVWEQYDAASKRGDRNRTQELELYCDGISIITLLSIGADPNSLISAVEKISSFNRSRFGIALNENSYPSVARRMQFDKAVIQWAK